MKPADEIFVWISTDAKGEDGIVVVQDTTGSFDGALASANLAVACAWKPLIDKIVAETKYKCQLVRYERKEEIPDELVEQTIEFALDPTGKTAAPH